MGREFLLPERKADQETRRNYFCPPFLELKHTLIHLKAYLVVEEPFYAQPGCKRWVSRYWGKKEQRIMQSLQCLRISVNSPRKVWKDPWTKAVAWVDDKVPSSSHHHIHFQIQQCLSRLVEIRALPRIVPFPHHQSYLLAKRVPIECHISFGLIG